MRGNKTEATETTYIAYRLPLTWVRVTGTRTEITDASNPPDTVTVDCTAVVTTETGSDPTRLLELAIRTPTSGSTKQTWTLLPDGRLAGADVTATAPSPSGLKAGLDTAAFVLSAGAPLATAGGPLGWLALGGVAAVSGVLAGRAGADGIAKILGPTKFTGDDEPQREPATGPDDADPTEQDVLPLYVEEEPQPALALANYRQALQEAAYRHSACVRNLIEGIPGAESTLAHLERAMKSAVIGSAAAEKHYAAWLESKKTRKVFVVDERVAVDDLPSQTELEKWCGQGAPDEGGLWRAWSRDLRAAVTVDDLPSEKQAQTRLQDDPAPGQREDSGAPTKEDDAETGSFYYRPPQPAVLKTWKLTPAATETDPWTLELTDVRWLQIAAPGNDQVMRTRADGVSKSLSATFDESGALTKITNDQTDATTQRTQDISALLPGIGDAIDAGGKLGALYTPPTLTERADNLDAAIKLGLVAAPEPSAAEKELAAAQYRAQLAIANQIASSSTPPSFVVQIGGTM